MRNIAKHIRRWVSRQVGWYDHHDLTPFHQIQPSRHATRGYCATGSDPHFRIRHYLAAGWYMVEVQLSFRDAMATARFYLDTGQGESEAQSFPLLVRNGRLAKRLIWLPAAGRLRFDPTTIPGEFAIEQFRIVRMPAGLARGRMLKKLKALHPKYQTTSAEASQAHNASTAALRQDYAALFERTGTGSVSYAEWIEKIEPRYIPSRAEQKTQLESWDWKPKFSILLPVYNTPEPYLCECIDSVLAQTYPHWELCIADDASTQPHVRATLSEYADADPRIRVNFRDRNGHIAAASNTALALASGEFVALLDHDDCLAEHALFAMTQALRLHPAAQLAYSDEDKLDETGQRCDPYFKPDWSPDLLYSQNYFSHLGIYRRELVLFTGGFRAGFEGSQDYDLVLRCAAHLSHPGEVLHVPQVLYHWRMAEGSTACGHDQKDYASVAARTALQQHFDAWHPGTQASIIAPGIYRHRWPVPEPAPLVSLIMPTRDGYEHLKTCIDSIVRLTTYPNYEILLVDNQTTCPHTLAYMRALQAGNEGGGHVRLLHYDHPFNYSAINNYAASRSHGSILGLINNDAEVISPEWLTEMVSHSLRPDVGCVGAKLYFPDGTIQHAGVVLGIGGVAGHSHKYAAGSASGYFSRLHVTHNVSAVTGAALVVRKEIFDAVGGLDAENLRVAFNDVDLCIKVMQRGYRNVWTPHAELYHHESKTRGADESPEKRSRFASERDLMLTRWGELLKHDPYYNPHLTLAKEDYSLETGH